MDLSLADSIVSAMHRSRPMKQGDLPDGLKIALKLCFTMSETAGVALTAALFLVSSEKDNLWQKQ